MSHGTAHPVQAVPDQTASPIRVVDIGSIPLRALRHLLIYTSTEQTWATFEHNRPLSVKILIGVAVSGLAVFITLYYHYLQDPTFHQNAYAILTTVVLTRSMYIMERRIRPYFRKLHEEHEKVANSNSISEMMKDEEQRKDDRDRWILRQMWKMIAVGLTLFLGGFAIWSLDNVYCAKIRQWRHQVGLPWGVLLEGHGWYVHEGNENVCTRKGC